MSIIYVSILYTHIHNDKCMYVCMYVNSLVLTYTWTCPIAKTERKKQDQQQTNPHVEGGREGKSKGGSRREGGRERVGG